MSRQYIDDDETRSVRRETETPPEPQAFVVTVSVGPDAGREMLVGPDGCLVGTGPAAALRLTDPTVSRRHVTLRPGAEGVRAHDHGSLNGTRAGHIRVTDAEIPHGVPIVMGHTTLMTAPATTAPAESSAPVRDRLSSLLGASAAMRRLYVRLERVARSDITVLIEGETGTGKEVAAETIHELSPRGRKPFVVFDCTAVPGTLMESELFGHEKGAFTGATQTRRGLLEQAEDGTLFIDEIGELPLDLQPKLLRAIERREFRRVGGAGTQRSAARIITATRRDLDAEVLAGRFRDDLFHRLAVARVVMPPLREREGDIGLLARAFCTEFAPGLEPPAEMLAQLEGSPWPGNVRELRNAIVRFAALGDDWEDEQSQQGATPAGGSGAAGAAGATDPLIARAIADGAPYPVARDRVLAAFDRAYVASMLARHGGNVSRAAEAAGIGRRYFHMLKARVRED